MFVRLFVDENLDRQVPISRQPREKIQAIIDSCTRQFPEHAKRARKRIRTYLKSCRRMKRTREQAGLDAGHGKPTPPHLTSVQAEHLLARACENEAENAKRMRMGLEPVSQPMPVTTYGSVDVLAAAAAAASTATTSSSGGPTSEVVAVSSSVGTSAVSIFPAAAERHQPKAEFKSEQLASLLAAAQQQQQQQQQHLATAKPVAVGQLSLSQPAAVIAAFPTLNGTAGVTPAYQTASGAFQVSP
jgi:hypothetical protein